MKNKLTKTIENYGPNEIIYPGYLCEQHGVEMKDVYKELQKHVKTRDVQTVLAVYCPSCGRHQKRIYDVIAQVPERDMVCTYCGETIHNPIKNTYVLYRKLHK